MSWPIETLLQSYSPAQVAEITGVSTDRQRAISSRYAELRMDPPKGKRKTWHLPGMLALAMLDEIASDLTMTAASRALAADGVQDALAMDLRDHPDGDMLLAIHFDLAEGMELDGMTTADGLARLYAAGNEQYRPGRVYAYNFSALQRRLLDKVQVKVD